MQGKSINRVELYDVANNINVSRVAVYYFLDGYYTFEGNFEYIPEGKCVQKKYFKKGVKNVCHVYIGHFKSYIRDGCFFRIKNKLTKEIIFLKNGIKTSETTIKYNDDNGDRDQYDVSISKCKKGQAYLDQINDINYIDDTLYIHYSDQCKILQV